MAARQGRVPDAAHPAVGDPELHHRADLEGHVPGRVRRGQLAAPRAAADGVSWFSSWATAFSANVITNTWLGFPFMMVVALGALETIPRELYEAASSTARARGSGSATSRCRTCGPRSGPRSRSARSGRSTCSTSSTWCPAASPATRPTSWSPTRIAGRSSAASATAWRRRTRRSSS